MCTSTGTVAGLAAALTDPAARERGEPTHRMMAYDLDISPLAAERALQALRPVVSERFDFDESEVSVGDSTESHHPHR